MHYRKWNNCSSYTPICVWYRIPLLKFPPRTAPDDNSSTFPALLPFAIISMSPGVSLKSSWHLRALILLLWLFHTHTWVTDMLWLPIGWTVARLPPHYHRYLKRMMPPAQPRGATWSCRTVTLCHSTGRHSAPRTFIQDGKAICGHVVFIYSKKESSELEMKHLCHTRCRSRQSCLCAKAVFGAMQMYARSN